MFLILFAVFCSLYVAETESTSIPTHHPIKYDIDNSRILFEEFIDEFDKVYKDSEEKEKRFENFVENIKDINKRNDESESAVYGITIFSDLTKEEFLDRYHLPDLDMSGSENASEFLSDRIRAPASVDWRQQGVVTGIRDQGRCQSCWAHAATAVIESQYAIKHKQLYTLSEKMFVDCFREGGGCRTGSYPHLAFNFAAKTGMMQYKDYPFQPAQDQCRYQKNKVVVKVSGGRKIQLSSEEQLKELVAKYGPVSIAIYLTNDMQNYRGGIYNPSAQICPPNASINHAITVVGYGSERNVPYWIIKNSAGTKWGEQGYMRLIMGKNACNIMKYAAIADVA